MVDNFLQNPLKSQGLFDVKMFYFPTKFVNFNFREGKKQKQKPLHEFDLYFLLKIEWADLHLTVLVSHPLILFKGKPECYHHFLQDLPSCGCNNDLCQALDMHK